MNKTYAIAAVASLLAASPVAAQTIDGSVTAAEYAGSLVTTVARGEGVDPNTQGPGSPGPFVENVGYTVYYKSDATNVYVGLQSSGSSGSLVFANLYFDTNNSVSAGSDIGFEVTNDRAFRPGVPGYSGVSLTSIGGLFASSASITGDVVEFRIPWTAFTTNVFGLGEPLVAPGGQLQLRTIQAFNYAGANGDGLDAGAIPRFGFQTAPLAGGAVPEPATWAMLLIGFAGVGAAMRRRATVRARVRFA